MTFQRTQLGKIGEDIAVTYLKQSGYRIVERNFKNKFGEIDIIANDHDTLCFIEVKTRRTLQFGSPFESVTPRKQRKIIHVASSYIQDKKIDNPKSRFDCVAVYMEEEGDDQVQLIKNAFEAF